MFGMGCSMVRIFWDILSKTPVSGIFFFLLYFFYAFGIYYGGIMYFERIVEAGDVFIVVNAITMGLLVFYYNNKL